MGRANDVGVKARIVFTQGSRVTLRAQSFPIVKIRTQVVHHLLIARGLRSDGIRTWKAVQTVLQPALEHPRIPGLELLLEMSSRFCTRYPRIFLAQ
jgi:hypothetical protein